MCMKCGRSHSGAEVVPKGPYMGVYFGQGGTVQNSSDTEPTGTGWPLIVLLVTTLTFGIALGTVGQLGPALAIACAVGLASMIIVRRRA